MNDHSATYTELPRTAYLDHSLRRARAAAEQRTHRYVTLEHLLLALLDDPDAVRLLQGMGADLAVIRSTIADAVNNRMGSLAVPDGRVPSFSYKFDSLFVGASEDAIKIGRTSIDGALALIAVAKDPDSNAAAILSANGFSAAIALGILGGGSSHARSQAGQSGSDFGAAAPSPRAEQSRFPLRPDAGWQAGIDPARPNLAAEAASLTSGEFSMDDMLANVRNILEAEERRERGLPAGDAPLMPPAGNRGAPQRSEPQLRPPFGSELAGARSGAEYRPASPHHGQDRIEPSLGHGEWSPHREQPSGFSGFGGEFQESGGPAQDFEKEAAGPAPRGKRAKERAPKPGRRRRGEPQGLLGKLFEHVPRRARVAVVQTVRLRLSREEAGMIFGRPSRRGHGQPSARAAATSRAVTVRLTAPEGGFFIEAASSETQWIFDRPSFLGEEAFGTWAWTLIPNQSGSFPLCFSMSARDVDENGLAGDIPLPEQAIKILVRGNFLRGFGALLRTLLLMLAGSGLTIGALYALKVMGKLHY